MAGNAYSSGDYAGLSAGGWQFYYGYEATNAEGEWLFTASKGAGTYVRLTAKQLKVDDKWNCDAVLMAGLAWFLDLCDIEFKGTK